MPPLAPLALLGHGGIQPLSRPRTLPLPTFPFTLHPSRLTAFTILTPHVVPISPPLSYKTPLRAPRDLATTPKHGISIRTSPRRPPPTRRCTMGTRPGRRLWRSCRCSSQSLLPLHSPTVDAIHHHRLVAHLHHHPAGFGVFHGEQCVAGDITGSDGGVVSLFWLTFTGGG